MSAQAHHAVAIADFESALSMRVTALAELPVPTTLRARSKRVEVVLTASRHAYEAAAQAGHVVFTPNEVELLALGIEEGRFGYQDWLSVCEAKRVSSSVRVDAKTALQLDGLVRRYRSKALRSRWTLRQLLDALGLECVAVEVHPKGAG